MSDLTFYNVGCEPRTGARRIVVPARRAARRLLRPFFARQVEILQSICDRLDAAERDDRSLRADLAHLEGRHDRLADDTHASIAFGWDYVALTRRLAALEDQVERLQRERESSP
jgi:hypothetical protein